MQIYDIFLNGSIFKLLIVTEFKHIFKIEEEEEEKYLKKVKKTEKN